MNLTALDFRGGKLLSETSSTRQSIHDSQLHPFGGESPDFEIFKDFPPGGRGILVALLDGEKHSLVILGHTDHHQHGDLFDLVFHPHREVYPVDEHVLDRQLMQGPYAPGFNTGKQFCIDF